MAALTCLPLYKHGTVHCLANHAAPSCRATSLWFSVRHQLSWAKPLPLRINVCSCLRAGSGVKGSDYSGGQKGAAQLLNSPWDLALDRWVGVSVRRFGEAVWWVGGCATRGAWGLRG